MSSSGTTLDYAEYKDELPAWQLTLISQVLNSLSDHYCLPEKFEENRIILGMNIAKKCVEINEILNISDAPPESIETYKNFITQINEVLHEFDPHLELDYQPGFIDEMKVKDRVIMSTHSAKFDFSGGPPKEEVEKWNLYEEENPTTRNFGFIDFQGPAGTIPENVGYINISHLIDPQLGATEEDDKYRMGPNAIKRLHEVMGMLQEKDSIILDLSITPYGGSPEMVQNIVSFFMPKGTSINSVHDRLSGEEKLYEAIDTPYKFLDTPVAIIIGKNTFSGREEIAYDLQQYNTTLDKSRFTLIGQSTVGGAHPECSFPLVDVQSGEVNSSLVVHIPYATSINPYSKTNWEDGPISEGKKGGITPDIEIPEEENSIEFSVNYLSSLRIEESHKKFGSTDQIAKNLNIPISEPSKIYSASEEKNATKELVEPINELFTHASESENPEYKTDFKLNKH